MGKIKIRQNSKVKHKNESKQTMKNVRKIKENNNLDTHTIGNAILLSNETKKIYK